MRKAALAAALIVPLGLLHAWVLAEICIGVVDVLFLVESGRGRGFAWTRQPWFMAAMLWWGWLLLCSLPLPGLETGGAGWRMGFMQALVIPRFFVFAAALQGWVLITPGARRAAWWMLAASSVWIGLEAWQQYLTGSNLFGEHRWNDGSLTGPFRRPRAGALYAHLLFASLLPPVLSMLGRRETAWQGAAWRVGAVALAGLGVVTAVLIGQRMGVVLSAVGLAGTALLVPQLRRVTLGLVLVAGAVLLATPVISPPTYAKLVGETYVNMRHFTLSPYGELFTRASVMGLQSPWHGWGYNGFRELCPQARFGGGLPALGIAPTELGLGACNLHPHNFYFQAFVDAGIPGLILFVGMIATWLATLARGLWGKPEPLRVGLLIAVVTFFWPFGSADEFPILYMSGWLFFVFGLALAAQGRAMAAGEEAFRC
jgi:hypothetical protein